MKHITLSLKQTRAIVKIMAPLCITLFISCSSDDAQIPDPTTPQESNWVIGMGGDYADKGLGIGTDLSGNVYAIGSYINNLNLQTKNGAVVLSSSSGQEELFIQKVNSNGEILWAKSFSGETYKASNFVVDASGSLYITGYFKGTLDVDPNVSKSIITSNGGYDVFILKLDNEGNLNWAKNIGGTLDDYGISLAIDNLGNVYSTGLIRNTVNFESSSNNHIITSNDYIFFTQKLSNNGDLTWVKNMGFTPDNSLTVDSFGNIYRTGVLYATKDFDPGLGEFNLTASFSDQFPLVTDAYIQKLDTNGNFLWAKQMGSKNIDSGISIAVDNAGNVYSTGEFQETVDFNPGADTFNLTATGVSTDIYVQKLDPQGSFLWAKSFGSDENYITLEKDKIELTVSKSGEIYLAGHYLNTFHGNSFSVASKGLYDIFIQKLSTDGNVIWTQSYGSIDDDRAAAIAIDNTDNVYVTGHFSNTVDFGLSTTNEELISTGENDMFIQKLK